jgi:hypothetical protein
VQHLILSTQRPHSDQPSSTDEFSRSGPFSIQGPRRSGNLPPPRSPRVFRHESRQDLELQSGVFVVTSTETYLQPQDGKTVDFGEPPEQIRDKSGVLPGVNFGTAI